MATTSRTANGIACLVCGGEMWDNREDKRGPKSPDFRCKDTTCTGRVWLSKREKSTGGTSHGGAPNGQGNSGAQAQAGGQTQTGDTHNNPRTQRQGPPQPTGSSHPRGVMVTQRVTMATAYRQSVGYVLYRLEPMYRRRNMTLSAELTQRIASEIFQAWLNHGCLQ